MNPAGPVEGELFENAPPTALQKRLGLIRPRRLSVGRRALLVVLIAWAPIVLLTVGQSFVMGTDGLASLLREVGVHARYLIAAPLLIFAEAECAPRLDAIARHFVNAGLIPDHDLPRYEAAVTSTKRLLDPPSLEIAAIMIAYLLVASSALTYPIEQVPTWHKTAGVAPAYSLAGWWHVLVSMPLLLLLLLGWAWRLALWTRLLWLIAHLDIRLVASHPDRAAGLGFVAQSVRAFAIVALALATIVAGHAARLVLMGGTLPSKDFSINIVLLAVAGALFVLPLLAFTPTLMRTWRRGMFEYGALARRVGVTFEDKWLDADKPVGPSALEKPDFSTMADLYSVAGDAYALRFVPIDIKSLLVLAGALLLPFIPVVLLAIPADTVWMSLKGLLF